MNAMSPTVLVVEDDPTIQSLVSFKLKNSGFEVFTVSNGAEAIAFLKNTLVDVMLLDLMMPVMSGKEVLLAVKKDERTKHIPVIILTAKTLEKEIVDGLSLGADDYMKKPFSPGELVARVRSVLARSKK
jgi:DNA-binding response OmpR family regulator